MKIFFAAAVSLVCIVLLIFVLWLFFFAAVNVFCGKNRRRELEYFTSFRYAHRGLHGEGVPENSVEAFARAVGAGYAIELDVQLSKDGIPVVFHDFTLDRVCGINGQVSEYTAEELAGMPLLGKPGTGIPRFSDVLRLIDGRVPLLVEIKEKSSERGAVPAVLSVLSDYHGKFMIESFNPFTLMRVRKSRPDIVRGQLSDAFMRKKKGRTATDFVLASFSLNFLSRPDFLSYGIENCDSFVYNALKKIYRVTSFAWTVKNPDEESRSKKYRFDTVIFEGYLPDCGSADTGAAGGSLENETKG